MTALPLLYLNWRLRENIREEAKENPDAEAKDVLAGALVETQHDMTWDGFKETTSEVAVGPIVKEVRQAISDSLTEILGFLGAVIGTAANQIPYKVDPLMQPPIALEDCDSLINVGVYAPGLSWMTADLQDCNTLFGSLPLTTKVLNDGRSLIASVVNQTGTLLNESNLDGRQALFRWNTMDRPHWEAWV